MGFPIFEQFKAKLTGSKRNKKAFTQIIASFVIKFISYLSNMAIVPLAIRYVNSEDFGIWLTLTAVVSWFSLFDIGFSQGFRNKYAEAIVRKDFCAAKKYVGTTYITISLVFSIICILFLIINPLIDWSAILNLAQSKNAEITKLIAIIFSFFCLQFTLKPVTMIFYAEQKPAMVALWDMLGQLLSLLGILILLHFFESSLMLLTLTISVSPIIIYAIGTFFFFKGKEHKNLLPSFRDFNKNKAKEIFSLGGQFFIIQIAMLVIFQTSSVIIARQLGMEAVTQYNIIYKYFSIIINISALILNPFWSIYTEAYVKNEITWIYRSFKVLLYIWGGLVILSVLFYIFSTPLLNLWVGKDLQSGISGSAIFAMMFYACTNTFGRIYVMFINGIGKIKLQTFFTTIQAIFFIPAALFLCDRFGITGVIYASILSNMYNFCIAPIEAYSILKRHRKQL